MSEARGLLTGLTAAALFALTLASINLDLPAQDALQSMRFHLAAACMLLPVALASMGARWRAAIAIIIILSSIAHGSWIIGQQRQTRVGFDSGVETFTVLSFNVLADNEQGQNIADFMIDSDADVAVIMETSGIERALDRLSKTFHYRLGCDTTSSCDLSILSRRPLSEAKVHPLGPLSRNRLLTAVIQVAGQRLTLVAVHLTKPYHDGAAAAELWDISDLLRQIEGPVIVAGDFNSAPWATNLEKFLRRNSLVPGPAYPATWPVRLGAFGLPIDHIFTRGDLRIEHIEATEANFGSNHRGILARVSVASPEGQ